MTANWLTVIAIAFYFLPLVPMGEDAPNRAHADPYTRTQLIWNDGTCPTVSVRSHAGPVRKGEKLDFEAFIDAEQIDGIGFTWSVTGGTILSGQGTDSIEVQTDKTWKGKTVNVTVNVSGFQCPVEGGLSVSFGKHTAINDYAASVVSLKLDEDRLYIDCKPGYLPLRESPSSKDMVVDVYARGRPNTLADVLTYKYAVSAGRIIGDGSMVQWDLTGAAPGTYSIEAAVDDGCGKCGGAIQRATVIVSDRQCWGDVTCPSLSLSGPAGTEKRNEYTVVANISGGSQDQVVTYHWSVTSGAIVSGQGTPSVIVKPSSSKQPVVTLKVGGFDPDAACPNEASITLP